MVALGEAAYFKVHVALTTEGDLTAAATRNIESISLPSAVDWTTMLLYAYPETRTWNEMLQNLQNFW